MSICSNRGVLHTSVLQVIVFVNIGWHFCRAHFSCSFVGFSTTLKDKKLCLHVSKHYFFPLVHVRTGLRLSVCPEAEAGCTEGRQRYLRDSDFSTAACRKA